VNQQRTIVNRIANDLVMTEDPNVFASPRDKDPCNYCNYKRWRASIGDAVPSRRVLRSCHPWRRGPLLCSS